MSRRITKRKYLTNRKLFSIIVHFRTNSRCRRMEIWCKWNDFIQYNISYHVVKLLFTYNFLTIVFNCFSENIWTDNVAIFRVGKNTFFILKCYKNDSFWTIHRNDACSYCLIPLHRETSQASCEVPQISHSLNLDR